MDFKNFLKQSANNIKAFFADNIINKLLLINVGVFLLCGILGLFGFDARDILGVQAHPWALLWRLWGPVTYMFTHVELFHILGNMLWLYFMGRMFMMYYNKKQTLGLYLLGGLGGAVLYLLFFVMLSLLEGSWLWGSCIGASASVTAIVIALCVSKPDMEVRIFGIFPLSLKWLGIIYVAFDVLQIFGSNGGGHMAHLGGALVGLFFAMQIRNGKDITKGINSVIDKIVSLWPSNDGNNDRRSNMRVSYRNTGNSSNTSTSSARNMTDSDYNKQKADNQRRTDEILDKISKSGYGSLSKEEKEFLFKMSGK